MSALETAAASLDAFIVDVKTLDPAIYRAYTGGDPDLVKQNLRRLAEIFPPERVLLRVPLIPGFNSEADRAQSVEKLRALGFSRFDLFSYVIKKEKE